MKLKLTNPTTISISTGVTFGVAAPTLVSLLLFWAARIKVLNPYYFFTVSYIIIRGLLIGDAKITILQATVIYLMMVSTEPRIQLWFKNKTLLLILYGQILIWFATGLLFQYVGGYSAGGFHIVNDFSLQLAIVAIILHKQNAISLFLIPIIITIFYLNDSKIVLLLYICFIIFQQISKNIFYKLTVFFALVTFTFMYFSDITELLEHINSLKNGIACGSFCFRVYATALSLDFLQTNILFGSGPGTLTSHLISLGLSGESYIMSGSIHNIGMELLAENGIFLMLLVLISLRRQLPNISLPLVILFFSLCCAAGQSVYSIGLIYILFGRFVRKIDA